MLSALIMAGGRGERFWPLSTDDKPKQFLNLLGNETMIQMTYKRLLPLIPEERIFVITGEKYLDLVKEQLPTMPNRNIIIEPMGRNTAPCISLSAAIIQKFYGDTTLAVLPSDHQIMDEDKFLNTLKAAEALVENSKEAVVTLGIRPNRPETGYGYIKLMDNGQCAIDNEVAYKVDKFAEKPNLDTALHYLSEGNYLWNAGMFIWKTSTVISLTERYLKNTYPLISEIAVTAEESIQPVINEKYSMVDNISVDYGIMEKTSNIYVIPSDFGWDDVGTWYSIERYRNKDENSNIVVGEGFNFNASNNVIVGKDKSIIIAGLDDIFVIESDDKILICSKEAMKDIKDIKQKFS